MLTRALDRCAALIRQSPWVGDDGWLMRDDDAKNGTGQEDRAVEQRDTTYETTGWVGWIYFAGVMLVIGGSLNLIYGLIAILDDEWVVFGARGAVYFDISTWGWIHLILGIIVLLAGFGVMTGNVLARTVGVLVAGVSMIINFLALPVYPIWALILITVDALVIYALVAHGGELKDSSV
jgi:hypothetical protein